MRVELHELSLIESKEITDCQNSYSPTIKKIGIFFARTSLTVCKADFHPRRVPKLNVPGQTLKSLKER